MLALFHGNNNFASWQELQKLIGKNDFTLLNGDNLEDANQLFLNVDSFSFFAEKNITVVKRLLKNKRKSVVEAAVKGLLASDPKNLELVFWEEGKVDKRLKFFDFIKKQGKIVESEYLALPALKSWLLQQAKSQGIDLSAQLAQQMIEQVGNEQYSLQSELSKLQLYLASEKRDKVERTDLVVLSKNEEENNIWQLLDAISSKDRRQVLELVNKLFVEADDFPYLISMITRQLKILLLLKQEDISSTEISSALQIHPFTLSKAKPYLHKFTVPGIKMMYRKLCDLDFAIKEGRIEARLGLNLFLASI